MQTAFKHASIGRTDPVSDVHRNDGDFRPAYRTLPTKRPRDRPARNPARHHMSVWQRQVEVPIQQGDLTAKSWPASIIDSCCPQALTIAGKCPPAIRHLPAASCPARELDVAGC